MSGHSKVGFRGSLGELVIMSWSTEDIAERNVIWDSLRALSIRVEISFIGSSATQAIV